MEKGLDELAVERAPSVDATLDLGNLRTLLGFHIRLAQVAMYRDFAATLAELDLTQKQAATLQLIEVNRGVSQVDLAATLGADRATMMAIIDRLEARDLLTRKRSSEDRRRQELHLTETGRSFLAKAKALIAKHEANFTSRFSETEVKALIAGLQRVHQQF